MSAMRPDKLKTILPRSGPEEFWMAIHSQYAGEDARKWKYLAMLALREDAHWPLEFIGRVFSHPKGHVTRCLRQVKQELRENFQQGEKQPFPPPTQRPVDEDGFGLGAD